MATIFEMIKRNAVPAAVMRTASKGALPVPAEQMLEILVYLTQNPMFAQDARMTLASFDLASTLNIVASPQTAPEVLGYYWSQENRRPALMPALIENAAIAESLLMELAAEAPREIVTMLLASERVRKSYGVIEALGTNPNVTAEELRELRGEPAPESTHSVDAETEALHRSFEQQHAAEIAAEEGKAFELVQGESDDVTSAEEQPAATQGNQGLAAAALAAQNRSSAESAPEGKKLTLLQRLSRMKASERVKTAFTGGREERDRKSVV